MIFTIGHSTHSAETFLALLRGHQIRRLADVRAIPRSRRHPQFAQGALEALLAPHGIQYRHFPSLGGLRKPLPDSVNTGWRHAGFRGYADYMQTEAFRQAVDDLLEFASAGPAAVMCAEAVWWQCHRRLLSDALLVRGVSVQHIMSAGQPKPHVLCELAREKHGKVIYPGLL